VSVALLQQIRDALEGVMPAVVATSAADGTPNITYLSKVVFVDAEHVALSNQFFSKTVDNVRQNPRAQITLIRPRSGQQVRLDASLVRSEDGGELFEQVRAEIDAIASLMHMEAVFKLRSLDIYRVQRIELLASDNAPRP
jgi:hypothetical protein